MSAFDCRKELAIVLPSLDPDDKFCAVVKGLVEGGFEYIVIVDDGSDREHQRYFEAVEHYPQCRILHHGINKGKGRGLKTAFSYVLENLPDVKGVVTIDGDGQHLLKDIIACGEKMLELGDKVVLGCRDFNMPGVPPRSVAGNKTTSGMFRLFFNIKLSDTQTGLRAIPRQYLEDFCGIAGERFEYETNMLLQMKRLKIVFEEQPIETVYDPEDYSSHYNAFKDSWRIFKVMFRFLLSELGMILKFLCSSLSTTLFELVLFATLYALLKEKTGGLAETVCTVISRICSSLLNFLANNRLVFNNKGDKKKAFLRYYCLCIPQMCASALLVTAINRIFSNSATFATTMIKMVVDVTLFFVSYGIQKKWVFKNNNEE